MKKEFVPFKQSMELKELGFDEECFATYEFGKIHINEFKNDCSYELCLKTEVFPAPTFSQAFRWFREKYDLKVSFPYWNGFNKMIPEYLWYKYEIMIIPANHHTISVRDSNGGIFFETSEEAEIACLNKLIEIVKNY